jgi:hypothetical protein
MHETHREITAQVDEFSKEILIRNLPPRDSCRLCSSSGLACEAVTTGRLNPVLLLCEPCQLDFKLHSSELLRII